MKEIQVASAIILRDGQIFVTQRGYGDFKNKWEFPGGKVEPGETSEQAVVREVKEELGCEVVVDKIFDRVTYQYPNFEAHVTFFLCHVKKGEIALTDQLDGIWVGSPAVKKLDWLPANVSVIKRLSQEGIC